MTSIRASLAFAAVAALLLACSGSGSGGSSPGDAAPAATGGSGEVVAEVNGSSITLDELDAWIKEDLFERQAANPSKLYELRSNGLSRMLDDEIVEIEAQNRGVDPERVIQDEVAALGPVSEEEIQEFYDANKRRLGEVELETVSEQIRGYLTAQREGKARAALREKAEIRVLLEPPRIDVAAVGPARGPEDAPVTIVEFSDFQCPYCSRALATLDQVLEKYPDDVRLVYRHFPLGNHSRALPAAEASMCAAEQEKFWPYHDKLFANARKLGDEELVQYADEVGLDTEAFQQCVQEKRFADAVQTDLNDGQAAGVSGTPAFFINGVLLSGARPAEEFYRAIDAELSRLKEGA